MVSAADAARFNVANADLSRRIRRDIGRAWSALGAYTPEGKRDALLDIVSGLVEAYGDVAASIAVDYFEATTGARGVIAPGSTREAVEGSVRAVVGGLWVGRDAEAISLVIGSATRHMLQGGRSSIYQSARYSPGVRFARVPEVGACDWCRIMASRGAVYLSAETAGEFNDWHDKCGCDPVAVRDDDDLPYDADELYDEYSQAWAAAGGTGVQAGAVARKMRELRLAA